MNIDERFEKLEMAIHNLKANGNFHTLTAKNLYLKGPSGNTRVILQGSNSFMALVSSTGRQHVVLGGSTGSIRANSITAPHTHSYSSPGHKHEKSYSPTSHKHTRAVSHTHGYSVRGHTHVYRTKFINFEKKGATCIKPIRIGRLWRTRIPPPRPLPEKAPIDIHIS